MVHITRLCQCGAVWTLLSNSRPLTWLVRSANQATFLLATVRCQGSKKVSCWRFLMLALMEWRWPRITTLGLARRSCWFRENQPKRSVAEKKWLTCYGMSGDRDAGGAAGGQLMGCPKTTFPPTIVFRTGT